MLCACLHVGEYAEMWVCTHAAEAASKQMIQLCWCLCVSETLSKIVLSPPRKAFPPPGSILPHKVIQ